jgi:hypothetical protein
MALCGVAAFPPVLRSLESTAWPSVADVWGDAENASVPQFMPFPGGDACHRTARSHSHCPRLKAVLCAASGDLARMRRDSVGLFATRGGAEQRIEPGRQKPTVSYERPIIAWRECASEG